MAQHQYTTPSGSSFSHPQSTSNAGNSQAFPLPPNKRQRLSPDPRPHSPSQYVQHQSPYTASPNASTPTSTSASPHFSNISLPTPNLYNTPYGNGVSTSTPSTPTLNLPSHLPRDPQSSSLPQNHPLAQVPVRDMHHNHNGGFNGPQSNNQFQNNTNHNPSTGAGMMGPPSKPVDRDNANDDQMDVLANAGVNLRAEEDFAMSFHTNSLSSQPAFSKPGPNSTGHAYTQFAPGDSNSFYGAGPANQSGHVVGDATQAVIEKQAADKAWADAALGTARSRQHELTHPHVNVEAVWKRIDRIARDNGVGLSTDQGKMPVLRMEHEFRSDVTVQTAPGPNGAIVVTGGYFVPADSPLTDQLALLSLATHLRLRVILEEAFTLASRRRTDSHGVVPLEWADVSEPVHVGSGTTILEGAPRSGWESAVSPHSNPLQRKFRKSFLYSRPKLKCSSIALFCH